MSKVTLFGQRVRGLSHCKKDNTTVSNLKIVKSIEAQTQEPRQMTETRRSARLSSSFRDVKFTWSTHLKPHNLEISPSVWIRRET